MRDERSAGPQWVLRRYQAVSLILFTFFLGSVCVFSRDSELFHSRPRYPYRLALTFDDGPHPEYTDRLLQILREHNVAATFFVVGKQAEQFPGLLRSIDRCGHEVANHTYHHYNLTSLPPSQVKIELDETQRLILRVLDKKTFLFRPPGGQYNQKTLDAASQNGYHMVMWNVFPKDHARPSGREIYDRVMASAQDGGVVLLHSGIENTLGILPKLILDLRAKGFQFLTVSEMLEQNIDPQIVATWYLPSQASLHAGGRPVSLVKSPEPPSL